MEKIEPADLALLEQLEKDLEELGSLDSDQFEELDFLCLRFPRVEGDTFSERLHSLECKAYEERSERKEREERESNADD